MQRRLCDARHGAGYLVEKPLAFPHNRPRLRIPPRPGSGSSGQPVLGSLSTPKAGGPLLTFSAHFEVQVHRSSVVIRCLAVRSAGRKFLLDRISRYKIRVYAAERRLGGSTAGENREGSGACLAVRRHEKRGSPTMQSRLFTLALSGALALGAAGAATAQDQPPPPPDGAMQGPPPGGQRHMDPTSSCST